MSETTTISSSPGASTSAGSSSTTSTLTSLYSRATKAFINHDIPQTHALITSAFQLIPLPSTITDVDSQLAGWRRKWDILRLTLETTVYFTPPSEAEQLPSSIRANLMLSPQSLLASLHTRSLKVFTPKTETADGDVGSQRSLSSRYLPPQVVVTLVLASVKLGAPEVGKGIIEDWLSGRGDPDEYSSEDKDGYRKVIELYCLHLLPRLEEWDLAAGFLQYEGELDAAKKQKLIAALEDIRSEAHFSYHRSRTPSTPALSPSRSQSRPSSPAGSSSSESSEKTETPITARYKFAKTQEDPQLGGNARKPFDSLSMSTISLPSSLSDSTDTSRTATPVPIPAPAPTAASTNGKPTYKMRHPAMPTLQKQNPTSLHNPDSGTLPVTLDPSSVSTSSSPGVLTTSSYPQGLLVLIRSGFHTWKAYLSSAKPNVGTILFTFAAVIGLIHYLRTRRSLRAASRSATSAVHIGVREEGLAHLASIGGQLAASGNKSLVDQVKRRLTVGREQRSAGLLTGLWNETKRAIGDTIQMAGQGLV